MITLAQNILNALILFIQLTSLNHLIFYCWMVEEFKPFLIKVEATLLETKPAPFYSLSDLWTSEELWPKEKSLIHIKLMKRLPKEISIWETRKKENYLADISLNFDSAFKTIKVNSCQLAFKSESEESLSNKMIQFSNSVQVEISGGLNCTQLPLSVLSPLANNITHLVIRETGIESLTKYLFGNFNLDRLVRLDIISNSALNQIQSRAAWSIGVVLALLF